DVASAGIIPAVDTAPAQEPHRKPCVVPRADAVVRFWLRLNVVIHRRSTRKSFAEAPALPPSKNDSRKARRARKGSRAKRFDEILVFFDFATSASFARDLVSPF